MNLRQRLGKLETAEPHSHHDAVTAIERWIINMQGEPMYCATRTDLLTGITQYFDDSGNLVGELAR